MNPNDPYGQLPPNPQPQPPAPQPNQPFYGQTFAQPGGIPAPGSTNPYDFILNPAESTKRSTSSGVKKLFIIIAAISAVVVIGGLLVVALTPKGGSQETLTSLAQEQQEIIRVAQAGERLATDQSTMNLAYNIDLSIGTNQTQLLSYAGSKHIKISTKQLSAKQDPSTDNTLKAAQATSTYDSAFKKIMADQLITYQSNIQQAYKTSSNTYLKQILGNSYTAAKTLLSQAQQP